MPTNFHRKSAGRLRTTYRNLRVNYNCRTLKAYNMYTFSSRLKTLAFVLMALGIIGIGYSFFTAPKTIEDVKKIMAEDHAHHGGHDSGAHGDPASNAHVHKTQEVHSQNAGHAAPTAE